MSTLAKIPELAPPAPPLVPANGPATFPATVPAASDVAPQAIGDFVVPALLLTGAAALLLMFARWLGWWRDAEWSPPRCENVNRSGPLWLGVGVMVVVSFVLVPIVMAGLGYPSVPPAGRPRTIDDDASQMIVTATLYVVGLVAVAALHAVGDWRETLVRLGLVATADRGPRRDDGWVVLVGLPILIVLTNLALVVTQVAWKIADYRHETVHELLQLMQRAAERPGVLYLAIANAVVLAPVFEEVFFRGHLQTALTALLPKRWAAIVLTSFLFAAMHGPWMIPPIFALSLIIGYVYERTGNLWVAIGLHVGFNAASTAMFLATRGAL
jgi:membrane protease YdiL (CAAX protease family)